LQSKILADAAEKIAEFNRIGLHYNLVASQIYEKRFAGNTDPLDDSFLPYIVADLIAFDMGRMMGDKPYEIKVGGFGWRPNRKLQNTSPLLKPLMNISLTQIDSQEYGACIFEVYNALSDKGNGAVGLIIPVVDQWWTTSCE